MPGAGFGFTSMQSDRYGQPGRRLLPVTIGNILVGRRSRRESLKELLVNMPASKKLSNAKLPTTVWLAGLAARTVFLGILIAVVARVASPQVEHLWSIYETPSDLLRVALGLAVCVWLAANIFIVPKDSGGYRTWAQLGIILLPLALLCAFVVW